MNTKCVHRIRLEELMLSGETEKDDKCNRCYGYVVTCPDYTDLAHLLHFYQLFKQDKSRQNGI